MNLQIGDRVYYTGDMANAAGEGRVARFNMAPRMSTTLEIEMDDGRAFHCVQPAGFAPGPGRRFWPLDEWEADRRRRWEQFLSAAKATRGDAA